MKLPVNAFKHALAAGRPQIGVWLGLASPYSAELCAGIGFDWLLMDAEHGPNDIPLLLAQLQAVAPYASHPIVRPVDGSAAIIKQLLDIGAQTLLIPMIETPQQAADTVAAMHYPPVGIRGVGASMVRASRFALIPDYLKTASQELCLLLQIETQKGLDNLDAIATTPGVDGIFIGPADLAASLGYLGQPSHPAVVAEVEKAFARLKELGVPSGILTADETLARRYLAAGATFVAVGVDTIILTRGLTALATAFKDISVPEAADKSGY